MARATELHGMVESYNAAEAVTEGYGVKLGSSSFEVDLCDTQGEAVLGVAEYDAAIGEQVAVVTSGLVKAIAGAAISLGANVMVDADAMFITATATNRIVGIAETAAAADGDEFTMRIVAVGAQPASA